MGTLTVFSPALDPVALDPEVLSRLKIGIPKDATEIISGNEHHSRERWNAPVEARLTVWNA